MSATHETGPHESPAALAARCGSGRPRGWSPARRAGALGGLVLLAVLVVLDLSFGDFDIPLPDVVGTLLGGGDRASSSWSPSCASRRRCAVLAGAALGLSGALTQTFARNPLASPDILGVTQGAAVGAVAVIVIGGAAGWGGGLVVGHLARSACPSRRSPADSSTAALLYVLSWRRGIDGSGSCSSASARAALPRSPSGCWSRPASRTPPAPRSGSTARSTRAAGTTAVPSCRARRARARRAAAGAQPQRAAAR